MRFSVLSSGSRANATFLESGTTRILIDCGLSATKAEERLRRLGIDPNTLDAVLVTHEHSDHIDGISVLSRRFKLPVFTNRGAADHLRKIYGHEIFETGVPFQIKELSIQPFSIVHDAREPVGFRIAGEGLVFAQATDLGKVTPLVRESLRGVNALVLESNHDEQLLMECDYPWELKQRISSSHGHLSNTAAATLAQEISHPNLWRVVLAHLSEHSNTPEVALGTFARFIPPGTIDSVVCGSIGAETALFRVEPESRPGRTGSVRWSPEPETRDLTVRSNL